MKHYSESVSQSHFLAKGPYEHITRDQVQTLIAQVDDLTWRMLLQVLWTTGARISEVLALKAKNVARIEQHFSLQLMRLKRRIPMPDLLPIPLDLGIKLQDFVRLRGLPPDGILFPFNRSQVWKRCQKLGKNILGKPVTPHMFRHGRVYDLAIRQKNPFLMARIFGHANIQTTLTYFHATEDDMRKALED